VDRPLWWSAGFRPDGDCPTQAGSRGRDGEESRRDRRDCEQPRATHFRQHDRGNGARRS
jgi:hypothetical protein